VKHLDLSRRTRSQKVMMNLAVVGIIALTVLITFSVFITASEANTDFMDQLILFFRDNRWWIVLILILLISILIISVIILNIQIERFTSLRIRKLYEELETKALKGIANLPIGVVSYEDENIIWTNNFFSVEQQDRLIGNTINVLFLGVDDDMDEEEVIELDLQRFLYPNIHLFDRVVDVYHDTATEMFYLIDKTKERAISAFAQENRLVIGYIYADTPEEIQVLEDSGNVDISSEIHRTVLNWTQRYNAHARKYSSYRWMLVLTQESLETMIEDKMNIRDEIERLSKELRINITLSGGFAVYFTDMGEVVRNAINAIELGQSRGGDQFVIHNYLGSGENLIFGGNNNQKKRSSRVMARSTALALHTELEKRSAIYITSHQYSDLDSIGAMLGIYRIALAMRKPAYFILDVEKVGKESIALADRLFNDSKDWETILELAIPPEEFVAKESIENSVMIVVDTDTINLLETPEIAQMDNIIVIDHHRKGQGAIEGTIIEYIDPFSSSSSELVAELIQYQPIRVDVSSEVATFLLAGIILDTHNFTRNVSSRTFEAASSLRKQGAMQSYILQVLSVDIKEFITRSEYLAQSEELINQGRIIVLDGIHSRQEIAKCADFLLEFGEVRYAIALAKTNATTIAVSARSKGSMNIQRVMEHIGGGGHFNSAAAQVSKTTVNKLKDKIITFLTEEITEGQTKQTQIQAKQPEAQTKQTAIQRKQPQGKS